MRPVSRPGRERPEVSRTTRTIALAAALAAVLLVAAPAARAQSADDASTATDATTATDAFRGWIADDAGQIDDQTLSRQRGGAVGMLMVAATPQLMRGNSVTLWDELAPPAPIPVPADASQQAQGNIASYTRR